MKSRIRSQHKWGHEQYALMSDKGLPDSPVKQTVGEVCAFCTCRDPANSTLVDPARGHCYQRPTKPCESWAPPHKRGRPGGRLSNTWLTYPRVRDNPGKLGIIPDRPLIPGMGGG